MAAPARQHCCSTPACLCVCRSWDRCLVSVDRRALHGFFSLASAWWPDSFGVDPSIEPAAGPADGEFTIHAPMFPCRRRNARKGGACTAHGTKDRQSSPCSLQQPCSLLSSPTTTFFADVTRRARSRRPRRDHRLLQRRSEEKQGASVSLNRWLIFVQRLLISFDSVYLFKLDRSDRSVGPRIHHRRGDANPGNHQSPSAREMRVFSRMNRPSCNIYS